MPLQLNNISQIPQVNTNGILSFRGPFLSFSSSPFPLGEIPLVAPFWGDVDITTGGSILYRETQDPKLLQKFSDELSNATDATYFLPTTLFIATWVNVAPFSFFPSSVSCPPFFWVCAQCLCVYRYIVQPYLWFKCLFCNTVFRNQTRFRL